MKLKDQLTWQVSNLELSKRIKELGVKQKSLWWWSSSGLGQAMAKHEPTPNWISAFTVAELGDILKDAIFPIDLPYFQDRYWRHDDLEELIDTEANARAKMLIYLLENGLIKKEN